jgi:site-specific recombinase XerD
MIVQEAIQEFLSYCEVEKNQSPKTLENYSRYLSEFQLFYGKEKDIKGLTLQELKKYRIHLNRKENDKGDTLSIKTQNYYLIAVRAMLKYLIKLDLDVLAPDKIELAKVEERVVDFLDREELEKLFASVDLTKKTGRRDLAILECLYSTGLRVSELCNLNRSQVNLETKEFAVRGKGSKLRIVFLSDMAAQRIAEYLATRQDNYEPLFISASNRSAGTIDVTGKGEKFRLGRDTVEKVVQKYRLQSGILKKVTPHTLRHSFATELLKNGADIRSIQEMLGHSSITTTQIYTHVTHSKLKETHSKFHK